MSTQPVVGNLSDVAMATEDVVFFAGKKLEPFTARRIYAANAMGMRVFSLTEEQRKAMHSGDAGSYNGALYDVAIVLYLCSHPPSTAMRALRLTSEQTEAAMLWAEQNDIHPGSSKFAEASEAFAQLLSAIFDNDANQEASPEDTELSRSKKKCSQKSISRRSLS